MRYYPETNTIVDLGPGVSRMRPCTDGRVQGGQRMAMAFFNTSPTPAHRCENASISQKALKGSQKAGSYRR